MYQVTEHSERSNPPKLRGLCQLFLCKCFYRLCVKVLNDDKKLWEDEVYKFARKHQLEVDYVYLFDCFHIIILIVRARFHFLMTLMSFWFFFSPLGHCTIHSNKHCEAELSNLRNGFVRLPQER